MYLFIYEDLLTDAEVLSTMYYLKLLYQLANLHKWSTMYNLYYVLLIQFTVQKKSLEYLHHL